MTALLFLLAIIAGSLILVKGTRIFITSASKIARHFRVSEYTISFLLIATATSLPETMVGITSALDKNPILSFGNAVGSNIALLTLIPALPILLGTTLKTHRILTSKDIYYGGFFSLLPLLLTIDGKLSRIDGVVLITLWLFYIVSMLRKSRGIESLIDRVERTNLWKQVIFFLLGLGMILGASEMIVSSAEKISASLGLGLAFIGLTITAIGTSLPEIAFSIEAARKHKPGEILGDILGSLVTNSTMVLGVTAVIFPIQIPGRIGINPTAVFMIISLAIFLRASQTQEKLDKWEAITMLFVYVLFILGEYLLT